MCIRDSIDESFARLDAMPLESVYQHGLVRFLEAIDSYLGPVSYTHLTLPTSDLV